MFASREKIVWGIAAVAFIIFLAYGAWLLFGKMDDPYADLTLWRETSMDEATRTTLEGRIATAKASISATLAAGGVVDAAVYIALGDDAYILGDLVTAREAFGKALNDNSLNPALWNAYANVLNRMGDLVPAEEAYVTAADLGQIGEYYMDYVRFLAAHYPERDEEVKLVLEHAIDVLGRNSEFLVALGDWYFAHDDCTRAIDHYEVAATLSPGNEGIATKLASMRTECTL